MYASVGRNRNVVALCLQDHVGSYSKLHVQLTCMVPYMALYEVKEFERIISPAVKACIEYFTTGLGSFFDIGCWAVELKVAG